jgi:O-antigen ligase
MNKFLAILWLVIIGSNMAVYASQEVAYLGAVILAGAAYFSFFGRRQLRRLFFFKDYLVVFLLGFVVPVLLMLISDRSFERSAYLSQIGVAMVFIVASVLALRTDHARVLAVAAFMIVAVGTTLNLYELFIESNVWSTAPGRSAGLYINPNVSAQALLGYGLVFFLNRLGKITVADYSLIILVVVGVLATFSRAGIMAALVLLTAAVLIRAQRKYMIRIVAGMVIISVVLFSIASYTLNNMELSSDAMNRISSLSNRGGIGDYREDRGEASLVALDLAMTNPLLGVGVLTVSEMPEGPHNMFVAMMVDYGIIGLTVYVLIILRLMFIARGANLKLSAPLWFFCVWLVIFGFASHNLLGDTATIPLFGFALARAYQIRASRQSIA